MLNELKPVEPVEPIAPVAARPKRSPLWMVGIVVAASVALLVTFSIAIVVLGAVGY